MLAYSSWLRYLFLTTTYYIVSNRNNLEIIVCKNKLKSDQVTWCMLEKMQTYQPYGQRGAQGDGTWDKTSSANTVRSSDLCYCFTKKAWFVFRSGFSWVPPGFVCAFVVGWGFFVWSCLHTRTRKLTYSLMALNGHKKWLLYMPTHCSHIGVWLTFFILSPLNMLKLQKEKHWF